MLLEGGGQGLHNPLAWDNMPSALQQKFPHWKDDTPLAVKTHSLSASEGEVILTNMVCVCGDVMK